MSGSPAHTLETGSLNKRLQLNKVHADTCMTESDIARQCNLQGGSYCSSVQHCPSGEKRGLLLY